MPYRLCPWFHACSCNDCPLDPASACRGGSRVATSGEERCRASRSTRVEIAVIAGVEPTLVLLPAERRSDSTRDAWARYLGEREWPAALGEQRTA